MSTRNQADDPRAEARRQLALVLEEKDRRACERSLHAFIRWAWPLVETHQLFRDNWHIGAKCEFLEAVARGQIKNLLINEPPGCSKSIVVSVMFPAWIWARDASKRFLCVSFDQTLSTRDNLRMRAIIESEAFHRRWPTVILSDDQNQKTRFNTTAGGWRIGTSIGGRVVGEHPHGKIIDDPHNTHAQLLSDADVRQATDFFDYGLSTRGATLDAWTVLLMQRLHERDLSAHFLERMPGVAHLCLPMRWEPKRMVGPTATGWRDPREGQPGALLWPEMWPADRVRATYREGTWGDAGQFQQRPAPAGGLMFRREWFQPIGRLPADVIAWVRYWDVAGTADGDGARTAGVKMCRTASGLFIITDVRVGRWEDQGVDDVMATTATIDGPSVRIVEEQEPGSAGKAVVRSRKRRLAGYAYVGRPSTGDKVTRARPLRSQADPGTTASGNVRLLVPTTPAGDPLPPPAWVEDFLGEIELFPVGALKDQVDAAAGAFNELTGVATATDIEITTGESAPDSALSADELLAREAARTAEAERVVLEQIARDASVSTEERIDVLVANHGR